MNPESHRRRLVVWDTPPAVESGGHFHIKLGIKCAAECRPDGWSIEVRDHEGRILASTRLSEEPWPGTVALYHADVRLEAPDAEGIYAWEVKAPAAGLDDPHGEACATFNLMVAPKPECLLTVVAIDEGNQTPVSGAKVVLHPYRALTDERGIARLRVPKGQYRLFVSGRDYFPFRSDGEVTTDTTITAELVVDPEPSAADIWV